MPPKKTKSAITEKKPPEKVVKKRVRAVKPKLKIPTVVKVKIPSAPSLETKSLGETKFTRKQLTTQVKIDLANEVARAQLVKSEPVSLSDVAEVKTVKRGRQKKVVSNFFSDANAAAPPESPKQKIKLNGTKATEDLETIKKPIAKKRVTTSTDKPKPAKKAKNQISQPKVNKTKTDITNNCKTIKNKNEITCEQSQDMSVTKSKNNVRKSRRRVIKGKVNKVDEISTDNTNYSPSILETKVYENVSPSKTTTLKDQDKAAVPIDSRKTSVTSNSSISWTKDISSSSTTTCVTVTSNDFVRFNRKIPIISLTNVDGEMKRKASQVMESLSSSSDSDSSSSVSRQTISEINGSLLDVNTQHLNLSVSSPSVSNHNDSPRCVARNKVSQIGAALDRLSAQLKRFDLEIVNWIGYENESNNDDVKKFHDKITEVFKEESDVIMHCRQIKKVLADETDKDVEKSAKDDVLPKKSLDSIEFDKINGERLDISNDDFDGNTHFDSDDNTILGSCNKNITPPVNIRKEPSSSDSENFTSDKVKYMPFDYNNDDDDALSLFAESITGFESSRMNSSVPSTSSVQHDEYIPQPLTKEWMPPDKLIYCPTKIANSANDQLTLNNKNKSICEKQNADSTSIKESEGCKSVEDNVFIVPEQINVNKDFVKKISEYPPIWNGNTPYLLASRYKRLHGHRSVLFKGTCFYYLISSCKKFGKCTYPHIKFNIMEIKNRLVKLSEDLFIQEYMLIRNWPNLRRKYILYFVEECHRRDLTSVLVEMSIDSIIKANSASREDALLRTEVIEYTLLHLNTVNLNDCKAFLMYKLNKWYLCDEYMQVISDTQNFSRFKLVFINLIQFIINIGRTFRLSVTEHILERVCILPYEEPLIRAVVKMIRNTDANILQNSMMGLFEKHLLNVGVEFNEEFLRFKKQASLNQRVVVKPFIESPPLLNEVDTIAALNNTQTERGERYTSPDTTNLDSLNKVTDEPIITRTINMNPSRHMGFQQSFTPKITPDTEDSRPKNMFSHWKNKSIMSKMFNGFSSQINSPISRPPLTPPAYIQANQRQVTYKTSPTIFSRRSGADF